MIKLAYGDNKVFVSMTTQEFNGLAGKSYSQVPDGTSVSLARIKTKLDLVDAKTQELSELKTQCQQIVTKLDNIGV